MVAGLNGQKIWTSNAQQSQLMIALVRTSAADEKNRHAGLSQFLLDLSTPGIRIQPIVDLTGHPGFNEVFFDDVVVGADCLLGVEGEGWQQVTSELSLERSGPERYLSSFALFVELVRLAGRVDSEALRHAVGRLTASCGHCGRCRSRSPASSLRRGPMLAAAIVKDLGNTFEQSLPPLVQSLVDERPARNDNDLARTLALLLQTSPSFSLRGGTREILRGIVARGLGLR